MRTFTNFISASGPKNPKCTAKGQFVPNVSLNYQIVYDSEVRKGVGIYNV